MTTPSGCTIEQLDPLTSMAWLECLRGSAAAPSALGTTSWALCHCDDGVTWGRCDGERWRLGSAAFADLCPEPARENLEELRIFSERGEVLIWRAHGELRGRILRDSEEGHADETLLPDTEERLLLFNWGHIIAECNGFTRVGDGTGREQALPLGVDGRPRAWWPKLSMRHYFARDDQTGGVRIVASRLVEVK